jgi:DNA-binding IclR family transcriptional regulator
MEAGRAYQSLDRGLRVIEAIADLEGSATVAAVSRKTGLPRSTVHHLLRALVEFDYLVQDPDTRTYTLSYKIFLLTRRTWSKEQLSRIAVPFLEELCLRTKEGASLAVLRDGVVTVIAKREPEGPVRVVQEVGAIRPIHCTAVGKGLAAWGAERELESIISQTVFEKYTNKTITSPEAFRRELARIRATGFAFDDEEHNPGIRCLATPVRDHSGDVRAALCVVGPSNHLLKRRLPELRRTLAGVTADFSARLGYASAAEVRDGSTGARVHFANAACCLKRASRR